MAATAQAIVQVKAQGAAQTNQEFQNLRKNITGNMTASERSVASSLSSMAAQYISLGLVIRQFGKTLSQGVEFNKFIENQTMAFEVMMKSADKAKAKVQELYDFAVESPLTFKETVSSSKQLMAYGFAAEELVPTMEKLGAVSIATGHSLADISYVYGTLKSQGRAYSRDLMQFGMRGIPIYEELAKVLKVDVTQIQKLASEGKIGFKEVERAFANMTKEGGRFGGILDKYMETLTGKIAMLSDIWEQSTGKMAEGLNKVLGKAVDELTQKLESGELDGFIQGISDNVAGLAQALLNIARVLIEIAPILATIAKIWIGMKITGTVVKGITGLYKGFVNLSEVLFNVSSRLQSFTTLLYSTPTIMAANTASINLFKDALVGLFTAISANPVGLTLLGLATFGTAIAGVVAQLTKNSRDLKKEVGDIAAADYDGRVDLLDKRFKQLSEEFAVINESGGYMLDASDIDYFVERFGLAKTKVEELAVAYKLLDATMVDSVYATAIQRTGFEKNLRTQKEDVGNLPKSPAEKQADFFASLTEADPIHYLDSKISLYSALGGRAADEYIKAFKNARDNKSDVLKDLYLPDDYKKDLQAEYKELEASLISAGLEIPEALNSADAKYGTSFGDVILNRMRQINKELEDTGGKIETVYASLEDTLKSLGRWWLPDEARVNATLDAFDNMQLDLEKQIETLDKEEASRRATINLMEEGEDKTRLLLELEKQRGQAEKDISDAMQHQIDLLHYQENLSGKTNYWKGIEAQAGTGDMGAVAMTSLQGSEVGSLMAGADPMTMIVKALADFAMSIENVDKALNPLSTILEGARPLVELFLNSVLQDHVNRLTAIGEVLGKMLSPIFSLIQLFSLSHNIINTALLIPMQIYGEIMSWINDSVIVPFGNTLIDFVNTLITWMNNILRTSTPLLTRLKRTTDVTEQFGNVLTNLISSLNSTIDYLLNKLNAYIDKQISSYQDLYEVGAISGAEYENMVRALGEKIDTSTVNISDADKALEDPDAIRDRLAELYEALNQINNGGLTEQQKIQMLTDIGLVATNTEKLLQQAVQDNPGNVVSPVTSQTATPNTTPWEAISAVGASIMNGLAGIITTISTPRKFDVGTTYVPHDMTAMIHKGEGIVPKTFMDGVRSGELSIGRDNGGGSNYYVTVNVEGNVTAENDLAVSIAEVLYNERKTGRLAV